MHRRAVSVISAGLLCFSACSGSGGSSGASADSAADVATSIEDDTAQPVDTADTTDDTGASDVDFCAAISAIQSAEFELEETFGPDARQLFTDVQASAPPEIADDVATVIATLDAIAALGISMDENDPEAVDAAFEILLDPDYTDASENLEEFTSDACGIDLGDDDGDDDGDDAGLELEDLEGFDEV